MIARVPGLIAQSREGMTREKKMRKIVPGAHNRAPGIFFAAFRR